MSGLKFMGKNPSGNATPVIVDNNGGMLNSIGKEDILVQQVNTIAVEEVIVYETLNPFVLDFAEFTGKNSLDFSGVTIYTRIAGAWVQISRCLKIDSTTPGQIVSAQFANVYKFGSAIFDVLLHDTTLAISKIKLSQPMYFPNGCKITVKNGSGSATIGSFFQGRVFK